MKVLWEHQLLPPDELNSLRQYFLERPSVAIPTPNSLPGNFLAYVERTIDWDEFWRRRTAPPIARAGEGAANASAQALSEASLSLAVYEPVPKQKLDGRISVDVLGGPAEHVSLSEGRSLGSGSRNWVIILAGITLAVLATIANTLIWVFHMGEWIPYAAHGGEWIFSALMLIVVAWARFNSPPTNRSGTTFALFYFGVVSYSALLMSFWLFVIIALWQSSISFDKAALWLGGAANPAAQEEMNLYVPLVAAFVIVVAANLPWLRRVDNAAREVCMNLAAIPREADRLAFELAQTADFQPKSELRARVTKIVTESIGPQALNFEPDGTVEAGLTRAVGLYSLFVGPNSQGMKLEFANARTRAAYARIIQLNKTTVAQVDARYEELMQAAEAYFRTPHPPRELKEALKRSIIEVSQLTCSLIAGYVLYCNVTANARHQQLSNMGLL